MIILDEPFANLDPSSQSRLKHVINEMHSDDNLILVSSHDLTHVADISTRILIMETGKVIKDMNNSEETKAELVAYFEV